MKKGDAIVNIFNSINVMNKIPKRNEADKKYMWHIEDIYASNELWESDFKQALEEIKNLKKYKGTLGESGKNLLDCLLNCDKVSEKIDRLYVYSNMKFHEDSANTFYQSLSQRAESIVVQYSSETSYILPEITAIPLERVKEFFEAEKDLNIYKHYIENILRNKKYTLSQDKEEILAESGEISSAPKNIFEMINDADMKFPEIKNNLGEVLQLTKGKYISFLESDDRILRENAFNAFYDTYEKQKNTLAATYYASVKSDVFYAKVKKYNSALSAALNDDNIPENVYTNLIETVHKYLPVMHRYVALRKKLLKVKELHMYDLYASLVPQENIKIEYEKAKEIVLKGLSPMGEEYISNIKKGFNEGWIDVYENEGKRSGAYSWGTYSVHPFVLLNHNDTINSMFTIAHEMGHALHSYYTWNKQPYIYSGHKIFVAEVASTVNEALLMEYLLKTTDDKNTKKYIINYFMEQFRGTLFRQTMFAEFEKITHEMVENGQPLTCTNMNEIYHNLNRMYFGNDIVIDDKINIEWARIPHFYTAFYVYQYATGYSAAITLSRKIINEGNSACSSYIEFLKKGDSEYSIDLLKGAGVDMTSSAPIENALKVFESLIDEMEKFN